MEKRSEIEIQKSSARLVMQNFKFLKLAALPKFWSFFRSLQRNLAEKSSTLSEERRAHLSEKWKTTDGKFLSSQIQMLELFLDLVVHVISLN